MRPSKPKTEWLSPCQRRAQETTATAPAILSPESNRRPAALDAGDQKNEDSTNRRGARVTATSCGGSKITISVLHDDDVAHTATHQHAAELLALKLSWPGQIIGGSLSDSCVWVFAPANPAAQKLIEAARQALFAVPTTHGAFAALQDALRAY